MENTKGLFIHIPPEALDHLADQLVNRLQGRFSGTETPKADIPSVGLLTRQQAAKKLGITLPTLGAWIKAGRIPAHRVSRRVFILESDLLASLKKVKV